MTGEESAGTTDFSRKCVFNIEGNQACPDGRDISKVDTILEFAAFSVGTKCRHCKSALSNNN